ncbi:MAG: hypothetical protein JWO06_3957 [Bacteroidota bacterium]|nr:hypothetical protein [Bacteroidota bacterium]
MMYIFHTTHQQFVFALLDESVDFLLVGGYAVIYHGYVRSTGDMDIWLRPTNENKEKFVKAMTRVDIHPDDLLYIQAMDFTNVIVFHFGDPPERLDFLTRMVGIDFDKAYEKRVFLKIGTYQVPVLHLDDLIVNKILSDRPKDKADVDELQKINRLKKD